MEANNGVKPKVQAKDTYVDDNLEQRLEVSRFHGLWGIFVFFLVV